MPDRGYAVGDCNDEGALGKGRSFVMYAGSALNGDGAYARATLQSLHESPRGAVEPLRRERRPTRMRRMTLLLMCFAIVLGGCRALIDTPPNGGSSAGGAPGDKPIGGGGGGAEPPKPGIGAASREEPDPTVVDARGQAVDHFDIGPDGRTVVVYWWGGTPACFGLKEVTFHNTNATNPNGRTFVSTWKAMTSNTSSKRRA